MNNPLIVSLVVSGIGMLMLFLALALLCGLMYLMTALIKDRPEGGAGEQGAGSRKQGAGNKERRVAVIAVALARAEQELSTIGAPGVEEAASPWQLYHRNRLLNLNRRTRTAR